MSREEKIKTVISVVCAGFVAACCYHYILGKCLGRGYPYNTFLFSPAARFSDFLELYKLGTSGIYFPFAGAIVRIFSIIKPELVSLSVFLGIYVLFVFGYSWDSLKAPGTANSLLRASFFSFFSFPVLFLFDRANFEMVVFIFLVLFMKCYRHDRMLCASFSLAGAIAMKLFPAVFLILMVSDRKYKYVVITASLTLALTVLSIWSAGQDISGYISQYLANAGAYGEMYVVGISGLDYGHSIFGLLRSAIYYLHKDRYIPVVAEYYTITVLLLFMALSAYITMIERLLWKKAALLVFAMCLFPHVSADYKLVHLFIPLFLFINLPDSEPVEPARKKPGAFVLSGKRLDYVYSFLFALLMIPKNYRFNPKIYAGVVVDPILMLLFMALIIYEGVHGKHEARKSAEKLPVN